MQARIHALDACRGLAAILVVAFHFIRPGLMAESSFITAFGYLAVDFFFVLSGVVLTLIYNERLQSRSITWSGFMRSRLQRLYPMLVLATCWGWFLLTIPGVPSSNYLSTPSQGGMAMTLVPSMTLGTAAFPGNVPVWSLSAELVVNAGWALVLLLRPRLIHLAGGFCVFTLFGLWLELGPKNFGANSGFLNALLGWVRAGAGFYLGYLVASSGRLHAGWVPALALLTAACAGLYFFTEDLLRGICAIAAVIASAMVVAQGMQTEVRGPTMQRVCTALGEMSYPLYLTHGASALAATALVASGMNKWVAFVCVPMLVAVLLGIADRRLRELWKGLAARRTIRRCGKGAPRHRNATATK